MVHCLPCLSLVVSGDFNLRRADLDPSRVESRETPQVLALMAGYGFHLFRQQLPTHVKGTIIDWVFSRNCGIRDCVVHADFLHACSEVIYPFLDSNHFALAMMVSFCTAPVVASCAPQPPPAPMRFSADGWEGVFALANWGKHGSQVSLVVSGNEFCNFPLL